MDAEYEMFCQPQDLVGTWDWKHVWKQYQETIHYITQGTQLYREQLT
jgi:hypothetical protein